MLKRINWLDHLVGVFVVIFGVTIAFYLNNWSENRKLEKQEQDVLESLLIDLNEDSVNLITAIDTTKYLTMASGKLISAIKSPDLRNTDSLIFYMLPLYFFSPFTPQDATYKSLLSAGKLEIISDFSLRKSITNLYSKVYYEIAFFDESHRTEVFDLKIPYLHERVTIGRISPDDSIFNETMFLNLAYGTNYFFMRKLGSYNQAYQECLQLKTEVKIMLEEK